MAPGAEFRAPGQQQKWVGKGFGDAWACRPAAWCLNRALSNDTTSHGALHAHFPTVHATPKMACPCLHPSAPSGHLAAGAARRSKASGVHAGPVTPQKKPRLCWFDVLSRPQHICEE
eukprot:366381-Chlamydomonas_euryale.AAC.3